MPNIGEQHANLDQQAYTTIKEMITDRQLLPGEKIPQEKLASELGISRTPLVNALKFLEKEKLVEAKPRRGYYVRLFTPAEMISIFELREVLEGLAARRAAEKISDAQIERLKGFFTGFSAGEAITDTHLYSQQDREFHRFITDIGAMEFLSSILQAYNIISFSYQVLGADGLVRPPDETILEHRAIIDAISRRNATTAEEMMRRHFKRTTAYIKAQLAAEQAEQQRAS
ncbi:MAG: GntR family transcriptional regulator [Desulfosarcinaceae bacterium]|nr:GntR family transcriptional regulator [Desulfosarcinaceae bacterium]